MPTITQFFGFEAGGNLPVKTSNSDTLDFSNHTLTGVTSSSLADATGSLSLDGSGNISSTALVNIDISGTGTMTVSGGGLSLFGDDTALLRFDGAGAVTESGMTSFTITPSGAVTFTAGATSVWSVGTGDLTVSAASALNIDTGTALQINSSGGAISIGNDAVSQNIDIGGAGTRSIDIGSATATLGFDSTGGSVVFTVADNNASAFKFVAGGADMIELLTLNGDEVLSLATAAIQDRTNRGYSVELTAGATLAIGDILYAAATTGKTAKADPSGSGAVQNVLGIASSPGSDASPMAIALQGVAPVKFTTAPAAASIGSIVFLGNTAGEASLAPPSTSGDRVWQLGILVSGDGADTTPLVALNVQFLYDIA